MSKEKILEEFWSKLRKNLMWRDSESGFVEKHITELINEVIDQTREETIKEVKDTLLPDGNNSAFIADKVIRRQLDELLNH